MVTRFRTIETMTKVTRRAVAGLFAAGGLTPLTLAKAAEAASPLSRYNPAWISQSENALDSMPCGGGDIGLNVWVENGDVLFYISRSGAFDETNAYLKLGRMRLRLEPDPFSASFRQTLDLEKGHVIIEGSDNTRLILWVDVFSPVVHVDLASDAPVSLTAQFEMWRTQDRSYRPEESGMHRSYDDAPETPILFANQTGFDGNAIVSYHRNRDTGTVFDLLVAQQGLDKVKDQMWNPLPGLTFGVRVEGRRLTPDGLGKGRYASTPYTSWRLKSQRPDRRHEVRILCHIAHSKDIADWCATVRDMAETSFSGRAAAQRKTQLWWRTFWERSHIRINPDKGPDDIGWRLGRNYQLFRYQLGTNAYGRYPTKFNGGNFTVDPQFVEPGLTLSPDYRKWSGGVFTAQNQRLVYWPMLKSGDFDLMDPQFLFYERALKNAELRTQVYWKHEGACFTEQIENFGLPCGFEYGWRRNWSQPGSSDAGVQDSAYVDYVWDTVLEICLMMLDVERFTGDNISRRLPLIESCLIFFDQHYTQQTRKMTGRPVDDNGHIIFYPGSALETYKDTLNSVVTIAALQTVITRLLALSPTYLDAPKRAYYQDYLKRLPPLPTRTMQGHQTIAPAQVFSRIQNVEIPQLYPVFPYGVYGIGRPDLQLAIDTWRYGVDTPEQKNYISWHQDAIFCARLGLTEEAKSRIIQKMDDSGRRMPTFWGPGHDWAPDHNWGGSGMIGLQEMLMQTVDDDIYLFPAWPREWDVDFRLHAPRNTIVQGQLKHGVLTALSVSNNGMERVKLSEGLTFPS
jgi:hypothetical protein